MINERIKKIIYFLLIVLTVYIGVLLMPTVINILKFIVRLLIPFIIGFSIAFVLQPLVNLVQKIGLNRKLSVIVVLLFFIIIIYFIITSTIPQLINEIKELIIIMPDLLDNIKNIINDFASRFKFLPNDYRPNYDNIYLLVNKYIVKVENIPVNILDSLIKYIGILIIIPIILIYFLIDYEKILCTIRNYLINTKRIRFKNYLADLNLTMGSYFRGVFLVMIILSVMFTVAFYIIDLKFAIFFGLIIGITNIIPYLGAYIGGALPFLFALVDSPRKAVIVLLISFVLQTIESNILTPYIQGKKIRIHPLIVIFTLLIFSRLLGIIGMMLAVPVLSFMKITLKHYRINKKNKTPI